MGLSVAKTAVWESKKELAGSSVHKPAIGDFAGAAAQAARPRSLAAAVFCGRRLLQHGGSNNYDHCFLDRRSLLYALRRP